MLPETERKQISEIASRYQPGKVFLFGSSVADYAKSHDVDIAVMGLKSELFFAFYRDLIFALEKPVDVIDLSPVHPLRELVLKEGVVLYG